MVDLALEGPPSFERLTVELHLGGRVLEESVRVGRGGALVGFPWYPWESRSHLEIRVKNAEGAVLSTHGPVFAAPVDLLDVRGLTLAAGGDPAVRAEVSHMLTDAPPGGPSTKALRIDYRFSPGWKYWALIDPRAVIMEGRPEAYSVWVYGDGSGDDLRMRFVDATGQTFQCDLATIDFKGWKQLRCSLKGDRAGYWGGALDGVVHHPIRITVPALIDGVSRRGTRGTLFLAEGHVVGRE